MGYRCQLFKYTTPKIYLSTTVHIQCPDVPNIKFKDNIELSQLRSYYPNAYIRLYINYLKHSNGIRQRVLAPTCLPYSKSCEHDKLSPGSPDRSLVAPTLNLIRHSATRTDQLICHCKYKPLNESIHACHGVFERSDAQMLEICI